MMLKAIKGTVNNLWLLYVEISEDFLREICSISSLSTSKNTKLEGGFDASGSFRPSNKTNGLCSTKEIKEDYDI